MPWWGILIIVVVCVIAALIVGYVWASSAGKKALVDNQALLKAQRVGFDARIAAQKDARQAAEKATKDLLEEQKKIASWYAGARKQLKKEARDAYEKLSSDPDALDAKLAALLKSSDPSDIS